MRTEPYRAAELVELSRLRKRFLDGSNAGGGYWKCDADLALYDETFAERIGWKWDAVLAELVARGWRPRARHIFDFGCGSGVANRRVMEAWDGFDSLTLADVSPLATHYAATRARATQPQVRVGTAGPEPRLPPGTLLLVSHVLNELNSAARARLLALARQADEVLWVEAGTHADSRSLIAVREELRADFALVAPCPHRAVCGMLAEANAHHWCHFFARVPSDVFQNARWAQIGRELGIDLRTLPYSFLALSRSGEQPSGYSRVIGLPREAKGRMKVLNCAEEAVSELLLQKRDLPTIFKSFKKDLFAPRYRWTLDGERIADVAEEPPLQND